LENKREKEDVGKGGGLRRNGEEKHEKNEEGGKSSPRKAVLIFFRVRFQELVSAKLQYII
jgi:hypothetical protein